jgi:hypothetical protein
MTKMIDMARTAGTATLMEAISAIWADASKEASMVRMASMVALEERLSAAEFAAFCDLMDAE